MADLSTEMLARLGPAELLAEFLQVIDREGKIPASIDALGPVAGRDVVLVDAGGGRRARQLADLGAHVTAVAADGREVAETGGVVVSGTPSDTGLADASADVVVSLWSAFEGTNALELAEADRLLRPGGRLLIVHDYGRDDVCQLWPEAYARQVEWSKRNGPFLALGFRIRVIHCWWTFDSLEDATRMLEQAFGEAGAELAGRMKRPRLEYNIAIYHRTKPDPAAFEAK